MHTLDSCQHHINDQVKMPGCRWQEQNRILHVHIFTSFCLWIYFYFNFPVWNGREGGRLCCGECVCMCVCVCVRVCVYVRVGNFEIMVLLLS